MYDDHGRSGRAGDVRRDREGAWMRRTGGRTEIDAGRFAEACGMMSMEDAVPEEFADGSVTGMFVPSRRHRHDYACNRMSDHLAVMAGEWNDVYRPLFAGMADDGADGHVVNEMYCMYVSRLCVQADLCLFTVLSSFGFGEDMFDHKLLREYTARTNGGVLLKNMEGYSVFNDLHNVRNFIKHNSKRSFGILQKYSPGFLGRHVGYENGMYAPDWLDIGEVHVDGFLKGLGVFFEDYCRKVLKEDTDRAGWDSDEYFEKIAEKMRNMNEDEYREGEDMTEKEAETEYEETAEQCAGDPEDPVPETGDGEIRTGGISGLAHRLKTLLRHL